MNKTFKTLLFDIENTPLLGYAWGTYDQNLLSVVKDTELLSFAFKVNDEPIQVFSRRLFTERQLVKKLWGLFNEADIIVGHNGDSFDIKMSNQYFIKYGLPPPAPYKSVDTKKMAKKAFRFAQNKLDYLGQFLFNEKKIATNMELWYQCMAGKEDALLKMEKYNIQDVVLLDKVYKTLLPWYTGHPNINLYIGSTHKCPSCGSDKLQKRGFSYTRVTKSQRFQCLSCHAWSTAPLKGGLVR